MAETGILAPDERVELIEGDIIAMAPQRNLHAAAVTRASRACETAFGPGHWVRVQMTLSLAEASMPDPDVAVLQGDIEDHPEDYPDTALLVIEVADTSLAYDRGPKASLYASAGIPEYWIVNLPERTLEVRHSPAAPEPGPTARYESVTVHRTGEAVAPLARPDHPIPVSSLLP
jgi:Uma2 family endonuclease